MIKTYSSMQYNFASSSSGGKASNVSIAYTSTSPQSGIYNATFTVTTNGTSTTALSFLVDANNNTVLSGSASGFPIPSAYAKTEFDAVMTAFGFQFYWLNEIQVFTDSTYFNNQGTSTKTFGSVSFQVTDYGLKSSNEQISVCGVSATLNAFTFEFGTPPGTSLTFVTYLHFSGTANGQSGDFSFKLVSMTVRS